MPSAQSTDPSLEKLLQDDLFLKLTLEAHYNKSATRLWWCSPNYDCVKDFANSDDAKQQALAIYRSFRPHIRQKALNTAFWSWIKRITEIRADPSTGKSL